MKFEVSIILLLTYEVYEHRHDPLQPIHVRPILVGGPIAQHLHVLLVRGREVRRHRQAPLNRCYDRILVAPVCQHTEVRRESKYTRKGYKDGYFRGGRKSHPVDTSPKRA